MDQSFVDGHLTRRSVLRLLALGSMASLAAACTQAAQPSPTSAPAPAAPAAKPTTAPAPAAKPTSAPAPAAKPTTAPAPAAKPTTAPAVASPPRTLNIGEFAPSSLKAWSHMAIKKDIYKEHGLNVEVTEASSSDLLRALITNRLDITVIANGTGINGIAEGASMLALGSVVNVGDVVYVNPSINSWEDIRGKKVLTLLPGGSPYIQLEAMLKNHGLTFNDVQLQTANLQDRERVTALISGQVDVTTAGMEYREELEASGKGKALAEVRKELNGLTSSWTFARKDTIEKEPDVLVRAMTARVLGVRYAWDHQDETVAFLKEILQSDNDAEMQKIFTDFKSVERADPNIPMTDQIAGTALSFAKDTVQSKLKPADIYTATLRDRVIADIGTYTLS